MLFTIFFRYLSHYLKQEIMDKKTFEHFKKEFYELTGKTADDNLEAFFAYLNLLATMDVNDKLQTIYKKL